ncbi:MAG: hypothetical protein H6908_06880 [Hyphomicrobiales bacterium]|nr:hypothetical protein [Hyphomicrobiales bacterium]
MHSRFRVYLPLRAAHKNGAFTPGMGDAKEFFALELPLKDIPSEVKQGYRVYSSAKEFVTVQAGHAQEAITKSGIERPYRVMRADFALGHIISPEILNAPASCGDMPAAGEESATSATGVPPSAAENTADGGAAG